MPIKKTEDKKTYILTLKGGGIRKVTVPASWKMTFGSLVPYVQGKGYPAGSDQRPYGLRFYEGNKENLRAVFSDVIAVRDSDVAIMEKRTEVKRQNAMRHTKNGEKAVVVEARVSEWVNPDDEEADEPDQQFLTLSTDAEEF